MLLKLNTLFNEILLETHIDVKIFLKNFLIVVLNKIYINKYRAMGVVDVMADRFHGALHGCRSDQRYKAEILHPPI